MNPADINLVMSRKNLETTRKEKNFYTPVVQYGKYFGSLLALDWLYMRFAYAFAKSLVPILDPASYKFGYNLSWIAANNDHSDEFDDMALELKWTMLSGTSATYLRMVRTVQEDLTPTLHTYITCTCCEQEIRDRSYYRDDTGDVKLCLVCEATYSGQGVTFVEW